MSSRLRWHSRSSAREERMRCRTVEIQPQQIPRMIGRRTRVRGDGPGKTQREQIQRLDKRVDEAHRIIARDIVLERLGQEQDLGAIQTGAMVHG